MIRNLRITYLIGLPFVMFIIVIGILIYGYGRTDLANWLIPPVIILVVLYFFQHQIQWKFSKRKPPTLNEKEKSILESFSLYYNKLDEKEKERYENRISLFRMSRNIRMITKDPTPEDIKLLLCLPAVEMTFYQEESFKGKYQHIILYPHPFLSPQHGDQVHITEIEHEDGTLIFSVQQLLPGLERKMFNLAAYTWAQAYLFLYDRTLIVNNVFKEEITENLYNVVGLDFTHLKTIIGLEDLDIHAIALSLYFDRNTLMQQQMPQSYEGLQKVFEKKKEAFLANMESYPQGG